MRGRNPSPSPLTLSELVDEYLEQHVAEANTIRALTDRLKLATDGIPVKPRARSASTAWATSGSTGSTPARSARGGGGCPRGRRGTRTRRSGRCSSYAVRAKLVARTSRRSCRTRSRSDARFRHSASWDELERLAEELTAGRASLPILVAGTGLRPEEWLALERRDLDLDAGVLHVRRVYTDGRVKDYGKQERSLRRMPLRARVVEALEAHPWRIDTPLVYPGDRAAT